MLWTRVARNALLPTLTIAGVLFGELIGGAVVTETVFGRTGIGRLTEQAVANQDIPVLQAIVVLAALAFVLVNLVVDLLYPVLDPRLRGGARSMSAPSRRTERAEAAGIRRPADHRAARDRGSAPLRPLARDAAAPAGRGAASAAARLRARSASCSRGS